MSVEAESWFALVDAAQDPQLYALVQACSQGECLVSGEMSPVLAAALPHLVKLEQTEPLWAAWQTRGAGRNWGIMFQSSLRLDGLRLLFKKFLYAQLPGGATVLFRFYDPRVFRTYLVAAATEERLPWFDGVSRYWVESAKPGSFHDFSVRDGALYDSATPVGPAMAEGV